MPVFDALRDIAKEAEEATPDGCAAITFVFYGPEGSDLKMYQTNLMKSNTEVAEFLRNIADSYDPQQTNLILPH